MTYPTSELSLVAPKTANSQKVTVSATAASTTAISASWVIYFCTVDSFILQGSAPTAVAGGTCQFIPALTMLRIGIDSGNKISIVSASSGTAYITPGV